MISQALVDDNGLALQLDSSLVVPWWSFGKTVIAAAALALVRDQVLVLDDRISGQSFTLRQLLQHQAGLPDYGSLPEYHAAVARHEPAWSEAELLERSRASQLRYVPGESWGYSNIGYLIVRRLLEDVTAGTLGDALDRLVLGPLGVHDVVLATKTTNVVGLGSRTPNGYDPNWVYHGLLVGPLSSAAVVLHRLMTGNLLPQSLLQEMVRPHVIGGPVPGRPWTSPGYGLGIMAGLCDGRPVAGHTGGGPGSVIAVYHDSHGTTRRTAAAFATGDDVAVVERAVLDSLWRPD